MKNKADLLLEIGCEEIPSRFIPGAMEQLETGAKNLFEENRLSFEKIETFATPRRLVLIVKNLDDEQADLVEKVKGPPLDRAYDNEGKPTRALEGFIKNQGVTLEQVEEGMIKEARYIFARREIPGLRTEKILPGLIPQLIKKLSFPRPMYWQSKDVRFARPIRWLLALYSDRPVLFSFAGIESGNKTRGHRFLAPGPFEIENVDHYLNCLEQNYIILDHNRRREVIRRQLEEKAAENDGVALIDDALLEEVTYLVEYPVAVDGSFDRSYLDLPQEVPITSMQYHQRYFPLVDKDSGCLLPYFVGISNNLFHPNIRKGYAKVLQARLADGRFFFNEDRKEPLEKYVDKLKSVVFLESLGNLDQKRARLVELTAVLGGLISLEPESIETARRIAHLCKADLVTGMVNEFPELQGVMGREYALLSGESSEVAHGIHEHYLPRYPGDDLPSRMEAALVSLADRVDTLAGCFAIGIQPTGSQDPYGLRRQAQGAVNILMAMDIKLPLHQYIKAALSIHAGNLGLDKDKTIELTSALEDFLVQRIRFAFREKGLAHEIVEAVLAVPLSTLSELIKRASTLEENMHEPLMEDIIIAYNRVSNLAGKAGAKDPDRELLLEKAEVDLYSIMQEVESALPGLADPSAILLALQKYRKPVDDFFDHVMVMVEDEKTRNNRLGLLAAIKGHFNKIADFSRLQAP